MTSETEHLIADLQRIEDDVHRIELEKPDALPEPLDRSNNVYLLTGETPALINAGHPTQYRALCKALRKKDVDPSEIGRIIYTSWSVDVLGSAKNFPGADHFVFSADMVQPVRYENYVDQRRRQIRQLGRDLLDYMEEVDYDDQEVEAFLQRYYPRMPANLSFVPVRNGHVLRAGNLRLEAIAAPGPDEGHMCLYDAERDTLFAGNIALHGLPDHLDEVQPYLVSLERLLKLDVDVLLPNFEAPQLRRAKWALQGAHRFINNYMSNVPTALFRSPTILEFLEHDRGRLPESFAELVLSVRLHRTLLDELVRSQMIEAAGEGLAKRYGVDVEDPRAEVRDNM